MARGADAATATRQAGYRSRSLAQVNLSGYRSVNAVVDTMAARYCEALTDARLTDAGVHQEGASVWILLASPFEPPAQANAASVAAEVLARVNQARALPRRCGGDSFGAAPPLRANVALERAAAAHAQDMARHGYLDHQGRDGSSPADRASRAGYNWRSVGENIASGQPTAAEVVAGWLRSPGHCANIMQPGFSEMGVAFAVNQASEAGIYWAQTFGRPR
ncbi:MAG TPA: CAP domain-containing protein [Ramlibacter sp.]|nr:CAP domain-containing protein [Ramlibacter sp.]